jgi:hypothetical protein
MNVQVNKTHIFPFYHILYLYCFFVNIACKDKIIKDNYEVKYMPLSFREYLDIMNEEGEPIQEPTSKKKVRVVVKKKGQDPLLAVANEAGVDLKTATKFGIIKGKNFTWHTKANFDSAIKTLIKYKNVAKKLIPKLISGSPLKFSKDPISNQVIFAFYILTKFATKKGSSNPAPEQNKTKQTTGENVPIASNTSQEDAGISDSYNLDNIADLLTEAALPKNARDIAINFLNNFGASNPSQYKNILTSASPVFGKAIKRGPKYAFKVSPKEMGKTAEEKTPEEETPKPNKEEPTAEKQPEAMKAPAGQEPTRGEHIKSNPKVQAELDKLDSILNDQDNPKNDFWAFADGVLNNKYKNPEDLEKAKKALREKVNRNLADPVRKLYKEISKYTSPEAASYEVKRFYNYQKAKTIPSFIQNIGIKLGQGIKALGRFAKEKISPVVKKGMEAAKPVAKEFINKAKEKAEQVAGRATDTAYKVAVNMKATKVGRLLGADSKSSYLDAVSRLDSAKTPEEKAKAQSDISLINKQIAAKEASEKENEKINKAKAGKGKPVLSKVPAPPEEKKEPYTQGNLPFESVNYFRSAGKSYNLGKKMMKKIFG